MPKPPTNSPTEVVASQENDRRQRRRFSRDYKLRMLTEADGCAAKGDVAALLRREGLYSSHLSEWRKQLRAHGEAGLDAKPPGRKPTRDERDRHIDTLEREKAKLERELLVARKLIELAGKAHEILGVALPSLEDDERR
jgi:transposase